MGTVTKVVSNMSDEQTKCLNTAHTATYAASFSSQGSAGGSMQGGILIANIRKRAAHTAHVHANMLFFGIFLAAMLKH